MLETSSPSDSLVRFEREKRILYHGKGVLFGCYGNSSLPLLLTQLNLLYGEEGDDKSRSPLAIQPPSSPRPVQSSVRPRRASVGETLLNLFLNLTVFEIPQIKI